MAAEGFNDAWQEKALVTIVELAEDYGTAESGGASTLTDTDKSWTVDAYANKLVTIYKGTGAGQTRMIASNTADTLTTSTAWTIQPSSDSEYGIGCGKHEFKTYTRDISIKYGAKDGEGVMTLSGGRIWKYTPEGDSEITIGLYALKGVDDPNAIPLFAGYNNDLVDPIQVTNTSTRYKVRLAIMWTTDTTATSANGTTAADKPWRRVYFNNARITNFEEDFSTDELLKGTLTLKVPPYDASGTGSITWESSDGTGAATDLSTYTG